MVASTLQVLTNSLSDVTSRLRRSSASTQTTAVVSSNHALENFEKVLKPYLTDEQIKQIKRAYFFAEQAHYGQIRRSGEPYITHPLAVAKILANMHMDCESLCAALLHDTIEDTGVTKQDISAQFSDAVADLVDGVSKLNHIEFDSVELKQAENFQKMALAMAKDLRVIIVKLADRLHNMRTLGSLKPDKIRRIVIETLEIYAPIAMRLGMNGIRMEFEDLGFKALYPMRARRIKSAVNRARGNRTALVEQIEEQIKIALVKEGLQVEVTGREKHLYSIYQKMKAKGKSFSEIMDIFAFRVIVDSVDACYRTLGIVHSLYKPIPGKFTDYIAIPKANSYQSLHTVLKSMHDVPIEIQIRTREMEDMANNGIAAHWLYKSETSTASAAHARARKWVQNLLDMQQRASDSLEFIESVKIDLFPDEVYVFTPKGDIMELPRGATAIDAAYAIHTDIGNRCIASRVNRRVAPLSEPLQSGQTIEIITSPSGRPNPAWFNYVVTARARSHIHHFLKNQHQADSVELGRNLLTKALLGIELRLDDLPEEQLQNGLKRLGHSNMEALFIDMALGNLLPHIVANKLANMTTDHTHSKRSEALAIRGAESFVVNYAKCCCPLPGDPISGYLSLEKGLVVHRDNCHNLKEMQEQPERLMPLRWDDEIEGTFPIGLHLEAENRRGLIALIATRLNTIDMNIERISTKNKDIQFSYIDIELKAHNRVHLARVMKHLRTIEGVHKITRTGGPS